MLARPALRNFSGVVRGASVMDHKTDEYWGTLLLEMAHDAREDGDFATAELLTAAAMK